jgi:hypothetical protein
MARHARLIERVPQALAMVYGPSNDAVGRAGPSLCAAVERGRVNASGTTSIPSNLWRIWVKRRV